MLYIKESTGIRLTYFIAEAIRNITLTAQFVTLLFQEFSEHLNGCLLLRKACSFVLRENEFTAITIHFNQDIVTSK